MPVSPMRIAVLSDIHGNRPALEAVLEDLSAHAPDLVVTLGDHVSGPLWAAETADLLVAQSGWVHIRGNHERQLLESDPSELGASDRAARAELSTAHLAWLASLPATRALDLDLHLCHGTPTSDLEYLVEDVSAGFARVATAAEIRSRLDSARGLILCGHSHLPRWVRLDDGVLVANPGSVGLPAYDDPEYRFPHVVETGSPHARYLLLERRGPRWSATFRALAYDWEHAARRAESGRRPDWAHALRTGYAR